MVVAGDGGWWVFGGWGVGWGDATGGVASATQPGGLRLNARVT